MRKMVQRPGGTFHCSFPSLSIFDVRLMMSARFTIALGGSGRVGVDSYSNRKLNPALSSQRCTRPPECRTASVMKYSFGGGNGVCEITAAGDKAAPVNSRR